MSLFSWLFDDTSSRDAGGLFSDDYSVINPATGFPMIDGYGGVDVQGNVYGLSSDDDFSSLSHSSSCDDSMGGFDLFDSGMNDIGGCGGFMDD